MSSSEVSPGIFTVERFLQSGECAQLIDRASGLGFEAASITTDAGARVDTEIRNNDRCVFDDHVLAGSLWHRLRPAVPIILGGRQAKGLNERFRLYRYVPGQRFAWHSDGSFRRATGEASLLTFMVYLNSEFEGGATRFESAIIRPKQGLALIFLHSLAHEGSEVSQGTKYVLRSDVMYGRVGNFGN